MSEEVGAKSTKKKPSEYLKDWIPYAKKRYVFFFILSVISLALPWIKIGGNHIFLLSFDHKQLHLMGVAFDMQELYLMPFLLILMFLGIFFITTLGGRVWCGWGCPQTIFRVIYRDVIETKLLGLRKSLKNKQKEPDMSLASNKLKKVVAILLWTVLALVASADFMWYFIPPEDFFEYLSNASEHSILLIFWLGVAAFLVYDVVWLQEDFCVYICPYSRVQSVMYDEDTIMTIYDPNRGGVVYDEKGNKLWKKPETPNAECTGCESCVTICPTHIDIRKGLQLECINCLECADACTKVMGALNKPSLITWTSYQEIDNKQKTKYIRFRTVAYAIALTIVFAGLMMMSTTKENMLLNINRTSNLYKVIDTSTVENSYVFLFQNTDHKDHKYFFEIVGNDDIKIIRPEEPFELKAGAKAKKVVILETKKVLVQDERKDTPIPIKIKAYALDDKDNIVVNRDSVFVYPRYDVLQKGGE
ncbi:MAG: cytochrome c oxidase accessory protein CcoG [Campylobacterales bacterium]|nr:cytochrome c oxidase accessory protein CcoG [Campylobacterales bacterium]